MKTILAAPLALILLLGACSSNRTAVAPRASNQDMESSSPTGGSYGGPDLSRGTSNTIYGNR